MVVGSFLMWLLLRSSLRRAGKKEEDERDTISPYPIKAVHFS